MSVPSTASSGRHSLVRHGRAALLVLSGWLGFAALQMTVGGALAKPGDIRWGRELLGDVTMALYWFGITLPIAAWHRRLRARRHGMAAMIALHLPLLLVATVGDTFVTRLSLRLFAGMIPPAPFLATLTYFADFDVLCYLAVVILTDAVLARAAVRAEDARAARLESFLSRARLEYLEAQLQPHFLFNALGAASELAYEAPATALRVLRQLALIFRGALTSRAGEVTLGEELAAIEPYLDIQRLRFPDWLRIDYDVGGDALDCLVPRFVLQPLVENAIRHGLTGRVAAGCIEIAATVTGDRVVLRVADNGVGLRQIGRRSGYGIGLTNVRDRLTTLYGPGEHLRLYDAPSGGAVAEVTLLARRVTDRIPSAVDPLESNEPEEGASGDASSADAHAPLSGSARAVRSLAVWVVCGLLWTAQSYAYLRIRDRLGEYTLLSLATHDIAAALAWALVAQLVFFATARVPLTRPHILGRTSAYLGGMAVLALLHAATLDWLFSRHVPLWSAANTNTLVLNVLVITVLVGIGHRRQLGQWMRERESAAALLSDELRSARERAASLQEIPPVVLGALECVIALVATAPSPRRTEQLLARLGDYLRVAIECSDEDGITTSREQSLARSLAQFERVARLSPGTTHPNPATSS